MLRKSLSLGVLGAVAASTMAIAPSAANAQYYGRPSYYNGYYGRPGYSREGYRGYDGRGYRHYRCHRDGTTGAIVGAIAGGLLGNAAAGYGDRTAGTLIGGGVGALAGSAIARGGC